MKKILITRRLLQSCEKKASKIFDLKLNLSDELYSQKALIEMSKGQLEIGWGIKMTYRLHQKD